MYMKQKQALTRDNLKEKREMIKDIPKDRIVSEIPKLAQVHPSSRNSSLITLTNF